MSVQDLFLLLQPFSWLFAVFFLAIPTIIWLLGRRYQNRVYAPVNSATRQLLSVLLYLVTIPGMFSVVLIAYTLFFSRQSLLQVNVVLYFLPVLSMITSLVLLSRFTPLKQIPGFERLYALMILLAIVFIIVLALYKMRLFIGFAGSFTSLVLTAVAVFFALRWALKKFFQGG